VCSVRTNALYALLTLTPNVISQPVLFKGVLRDGNGLSVFSNGLSKYSRTSLYGHGSKR